MGRREKTAKAEKYTSSEEDKRKRKAAVEAANSDDDAEANEDLSLKIIEKFKQRRGSSDPRSSGGASEIVVTDLREEKKKKEKKKRKKSKEIEVPEDFVSSEIDTGFRDFCGDLFLVDNVKNYENVETDKAAEVSTEAVETNPVEAKDNVVLRKLLRGPRYFDAPDNSWGACYNCGEEGHTIANCTSARRKKPCFVCGSFEHNAKQCTKGRDCFICKQHGHRAKDCTEKYKSSKMCLKCGDLGHDMFSCRSDYCPDDLKEIQCYICGSFGHLCCINYSDSGPREVTCYKCGLSGHTGLACMGHRAETNGTVTSYSCYKCGLEGHFARECMNSVKAGKKIHEPSTPNQRSSKKNRDDRIEARSAPHDLDKPWKKKKSQYTEFSSAAKTKHRGGWIAEDPEEDYYYSKNKENNNWRSPAGSNDRRARIPSTHDDYASTSHSSRRTHKLNFSNSPANGSSRYYQHRYSTSRFGNNSNDGTGRNNNWW
ncbi:hypothetical protein ABFX02_14G230700 [Erythranthe guttata]